MQPIEQVIQQGYQARREGRPSDAARLFEKAIEESRSLLAQALKGAGQIERDEGQADHGIARYEEALAIERSLGDRQRIAHTLRHLGDMHLNQGRPDAAEPFYEEAMRMYRSETGAGALDLANAILGYSKLRQLRGDIDGATALLKEARGLYRALGIDAGVEDCDGRLNGLTRPDATA